MCSFRTQLQSCYCDGAYKDDLELRYHLHPRVRVAWDEKENGMDDNHGREWCLTGVQLVFNLHDHLTMDDIAFR